MQGTSDLYSLLSVTCGPEFLISFLVSETLLFVVALVLLFVVRQQHALALFLPLTFLPLFIGSFCSLITLSSAIELLRGVDANSVDKPDGIVLLAMSAAPVLFGVVVTMPAFCAVVFGRALMVLQANRPPKTKKQSGTNGQPESSSKGNALASATENYMAELARKRR